MILDEDIPLRARVDQMEARILKARQKDRRAMAAMRGRIEYLEESIGGLYGKVEKIREAQHELQLVY